MIEIGPMQLLSHYKQNLFNPKEILKKERVTNIGHTLFYAVTLYLDYAIVHRFCSHIERIDPIQRSALVFYIVTILVLILYELSQLIFPSQFVLFGDQKPNLKGYYIKLSLVANHLSHEHR